MKVKRIIANLSAPNPAAVDDFYRGLLGLDLAMAWSTHAPARRRARRISGCLACSRHGR